jgi:hypothetical protein
MRKKRGEEIGRFTNNDRKLHKMRGRNRYNACKVEVAKRVIDGLWLALALWRCGRISGFLR